MALTVDGGLAMYFLFSIVDFYLLFLIVFHLSFSICHWSFFGRKQ